MTQNGANMTRIYDIETQKAIKKRTHKVQLHHKNADRSARLIVLLKAAIELKVYCDSRSDFKEAQEIAVKHCNSHSDFRFHNGCRYFSTVYFG